jgi:hypothetical protein
VPSDSDAEAVISLSAFVKLWARNVRGEISEVLEVSEAEVSGEEDEAVSDTGTDVDDDVTSELDTGRSEDEAVVEFSVKAATDVEACSDTGVAVYVEASSETGGCASEDSTDVVVADEPVPSVEAVGVFMTAQGTVICSLTASRAADTARSTKCRQSKLHDVFI